jgi:hypothetical protein
MVVIRLDRRILYAVLGILVVVVALGVGVWLGQAAGGSSPSTAAAVPAAPGQAQPVQPQAPAAAQPQNPAAQPASPNVPLVTIDEARQLYGQPNVVMVDARTAEEFKGPRVKGAVNAPSTDMSKLSQLPKDKDLIIYCN